MGVPYLQRVLNSVLTSHIQRTLPELMTRLQNKRAAAMTELESLQQEEHTETLLSRCVRCAPTGVRSAQARCVVLMLRLP